MFHRADDSTKTRRRGSICRATPVRPGRGSRRPCRRFPAAGPSPRSPWSRRGLDRQRAWRAAIPAVRHLYRRRRHHRGGTARGGRRRFGVRDRAAGGQSRRLGHRVGDHLARGDQGPRTWQAGGGVDGCGGGLRRLLRLDGRRRDRGQSGHDHRFDRCASPENWWFGTSRSGWASGQIPCAPTPMPTPGRSTSHSRRSSRPIGRPRRTCSTPTSWNASPKAAT